MKLLDVRTTIAVIYNSLKGIFAFRQTEEKYNFN